MVDDNLEDDELCEHPMTIINVFDNVAEIDSFAIYNNVVMNERANKDLIFNWNGRKHIVNGRVGKDTYSYSTIGEYACHKCNSKSDTVDHTLVSRSIFTLATDFHVEVFDKSLSDFHSPIYITLITTCIPTPRDEPVELSNTVIQLPNYKSKWKPECTDIYNNSFDSNELTTINDEINLFWDMVLHHNMKLILLITKYVINSTIPAK